MKNLNILKAITFFSAVIFLQAFGASMSYADTCERDVDNIEILDSNFVADGSCTVTPDIAIFPLLKVGLCKEVPTYENYLANCNFLVEYSTAESVEVSTSTTIQLANSITLDEGTYEAAVLVVGNTIGLKHSDIFENTQSGQEYDTDEDEYVITRGKYCSTRLHTGNLDQFDSANGANGETEVLTLESFLNCSSSALTAGNYTEDVGAYLSDELCEIDLVTGEVDAPDALTTPYSDELGIVQICALDANGDPNQPGVQQLAIQTLPNPVTINSETSTINVGFELTDMLQFERHDADGIFDDADVVGETFINAFVESVGLKITTE